MNKCLHKTLKLLIHLRQVDSSTNLAEMSISCLHSKWFTLFFIFLIIEIVSVNANCLPGSGLHAMFCTI